MKKQEIILLVGLPSSGKTTYCKSFDDKTYKIIHIDEIRGTVQEDEKSTDKPFIIMENQAKIFLQQGYSVVIDATNCKMIYREKTFNFLDKNHEYYRANSLSSY
ncbi:MAG: AAA family ATPase [Clostridia bacterium]